MESTKLNPPIIGLYSDTPQSGKSTTADFLSNECGEYSCFYHCSFANTLKEMIEQVLIVHLKQNYPVLEYFSDEAKESPIPGIGKSYRELCQTLGTDWGREMIHPDIWVNTTKADTQYLMKPGNTLVFDDVRFENEAEMIKEAGGIMVKVTRGLLNLYPEDNKSESHKSDGQLNNYKFDYILMNTGSVSHLYDRIRYEFLPEFYDEN